MKNSGRDKRCCGCSSARCVLVHLRIAAHQELAGRDKHQLEPDRRFDGQELGQSGDGGPVAPVPSPGGAALAVFGTAGTVACGGVASAIRGSAAAGICSESMDEMGQTYWAGSSQSNKPRRSSLVSASKRDELIAAPQQRGIAGLARPAGRGASSPGAPMRWPRWSPSSPSAIGWRPASAPRRRRRSPRDRGSMASTHFSPGRMLSGDDPHTPAGRPQVGRQPVRKLGVLVRVADEHLARIAARSGLFAAGAATSTGAPNRAAYRVVRSAAMAARRLGMASRLTAVLDQALDLLPLDMPSAKSRYTSRK